MAAEWRLDPALALLVPPFNGVRNWYEDRRCRFVRLGPAWILTYGATMDEGHREHARWAGRFIR